MIGHPLVAQAASTGVESPLSVIATVTALVRDHCAFCDYLRHFMTAPLPEALESAAGLGRKGHLRDDVQSIRDTFAARWREAIGQIERLRGQLEQQFSTAFDAGDGLPRPALNHPPLGGFAPRKIGRLIHRIPDLLRKPSSPHTRPRGRCPPIKIRPAGCPSLPCS